MSSIISGYNYDIFISYRQKDNKHDGWVTEFVNNLKDELETTFKEEISVYFDINPHDGLLETHDVDESLKEKLKCLIFIPIISRTYCDPKSFAWQHEFKAFVEMASKDQFGPKVKLPNGNVASRILPVRIHDLDDEDIKLCESVLGTRLRGIDFIYQSPGVNRPLLSTEKNPGDNLKHIDYRDQINKVANTIREIIIAIRKPDAVSNKRVTESSEDSVKSVQNRKKQVLFYGSTIISALIIGGFLFFAAFLKKPQEKSIAVLPFENQSSETSQTIMLANEIINHLFKVRSFDRVVPLSSSVMSYEKNHKRFDKVASELNVNYILWGTYMRIGDSLKVSAHLLDPEKDVYIWQHDYGERYSAKDLITIQFDIALKIASNLKANVTDEESRGIREIGTTNQKACELVQRARYLWNYSNFNDSLIQIFDLANGAIRLDSNYADAYAWAGLATILRGRFSGTTDMQSVMPAAESLFEKALKINPENGFAHMGMATVYEFSKWDYIEAQKEYLKSLKLLPNEPLCNEIYAEFLIRRGLRADSRSYLMKSEKNTGLDIRMMLRSGLLSFKRKQAYKSINSFRMTNGLKNYQYIGESFIWLNKYDSALYYLKSAVDRGDKDVKSPRFMTDLALAAYKTNDTKLAQETINRIIENSKVSSAGNPEYFIGWYYAGIENADSSFIWLEKAFSKKSPEMIWVKSDPVLSSLKNDKRYWDLYRQTGHKAYDEYKSLKKNK